MEIVVYGNGSFFDLNKFNQVKNREAFNKPFGGLWGAPIKDCYGWKEWCADNDYYPEGPNYFNSEFKLIIEGNILTIDRYEDLNYIPFIPYKNYDLYYPDFEAMVRQGTDAIHLTESGEQATRYTDPNLYGWDCECVLVLNPKSIKEKINVQTISRMPVIQSCKL